MKHLTSLLIFAITLISPSPGADQGRPNIIFILADDLGWQDVGFMGSKYFETPHLDALAKHSLVLENAFMYPTCSPSRAAILTGRQSFRTGCYTVPVLEKGNSSDNIFSRWTVGEEHPVFSQPLKKAGYQLIHLGKWHIVGPNPAAETPGSLQKKLTQPGNGDLSWVAAHKTPEIRKYYPTGRGFDENVGGTWWGDPARGYDKGYNAPGGGYVAPFKNPFIEDKPDDGWLTDRLTSDAIDFIERHKDGPFFVNLHYYAPHRPSVPRSEALRTHFLKKKGDPSTGQGMGPAKKKKEVADYATMIKSIDDNVKRLTDYLDQAGLRDNTVIVFTSDNGFNGLQSANKNLRGAKGNVYDGGLRVPALVHWPSVVRASRNATPVHGLDLFPTFLDLAGVDDYTATLDGDSWLPLMQGRELNERALFWHIASTYKDPPCSIIRKGEWKLIQYLKKGDIELYNTNDDQAEKKNLAKSHPEIAQQMLKQLVEWRTKNEVPLPPSSELRN
ncbi:sulfatase [Haloferula rosea]|uniref:Sulfatase n=1 Tax=Haloferula rosea TaxID=490093 RepID=A0A934RA11_9BACT|nr:sulfatase [Haloferula rosea]MBK1825549.1 sulfatase [Haloferula rosea]